MSSPPTAQASSSGIDVTDGGRESESSSTGDDQSDGDAEDDSSSSGSLPDTVASGALVSAPLLFASDTNNAVTRRRGAHPDSASTGVAA